MFETIKKWLKTKTFPKRVKINPKGKIPGLSKEDIPNPYGNDPTTSLKFSKQINNEKDAELHL